MLSDAKRWKARTKILKIVTNGSNVEARQEEKGKREKQHRWIFPHHFSLIPTEKWHKVKGSYKEGFMRATPGRNNGSAFRIQKAHCAKLPYALLWTKDGLGSKEMKKLEYASDFDIQVAIRDTESVLWLNWLRTPGLFQWGRDRVFLTNECHNLPPWLFPYNTYFSYYNSQHNVSMIALCRRHK